MSGEMVVASQIGGQEFALLKVNPAEIIEIIRENPGGDGLTARDLDRVKIPSGGGAAWELPSLEGGEVAKEFVGVVLLHKNARVFWKQGMEETGGNTPPDCASDDGEHGVGDPGGDCIKCPFAQFGSDIRGGKGQACKQLKQVFVIRPSNIIPLMLSLPPTSLGEAKKYFLRLANVGRHYSSVLTKFSLSKEKNGDGIEYSKVVMSKVADLSGEQTAAFRSIAQTMKPWLEKVKATEEDYVAGEAAPATPAESAPAAAPLDGQTYDTPTQPPAADAPAPAEQAPAVPTDTIPV